MLILSRKVHEQIVIGGDIRLTVLRINGARVRLGVDAPTSIPIRRMELPLRESGLGMVGKGIEDKRRNP